MKKGIHMRYASLSTHIFLLLLAGCASKNGAVHKTQPAARSSGMQTTSTVAPQKTTRAATGHDPAGFPAYIKPLKAKASDQDIDRATLDAVFTHIHFVDHVISSDPNQPEKKG